jgi:hypothetical protein
MNSLTSPHVSTRPQHSIIRALSWQLAAHGLSAETVARRLRLPPEVNAANWTEALRSTRLTASANRVANALLSAVASDGVITTTITDLAALASTSRSGAQRAVVSLELAGLLIRKPLTSPAGRRSASRYQLSIGGRQ